jgi:uncharacterized protein (TIGR02646 family)
VIRIQRTGGPPCLVDAPCGGNAYRKREVVKALWEMQHGKCCYSEMLIPQEGHGKAVEHFQPKSIFAWRRNEWENLLLVCPQCNGRKRDQFPVMLTDSENEAKVVYLKTSSGDTPAIIDPSAPDEGDPDPEDHLTYILDDTDALYGQIKPRKESELARLTIEVTGIDDDVFLRSRVGRLLDVLVVRHGLLLKAEQAYRAGGRRDPVEAQLAWFEGAMRDTEEFAGLSREFARHKRLDQRFGIDIPGPTITASA